MEIYVLICFPLLLAVVSFAFAFVRINKMNIVDYRQRPMYSRINTMRWSSVLVLFLVFTLSAISIALLDYNNKAEVFTDVEVWNGTVLGKDRIHGEYTESYSCNCRKKTRRVAYTTTETSGKTSRTVTKYRTETYEECDTCHRQWYTVKWTCNTTFGGINIAKKESLSTSVYNTPNPAAYDQIVVGDPASTTKNYTNYLQGSENSILHQRQRQIPAEFKIPNYPTNIYNIYKLDRFFTDLEMTQSDKDSWVKMVSELNRDVGAKKQANIIVYVTKFNPDFADSVEAKWDGLNKNDIVVIIGSDGTRVRWARVLSWTKREDFKIITRDRVMALPTLDMRQVSAILTEEVATKFERRHMKDFEYLKNEIQVPIDVIFWWIGLTTVAFILTVVFVLPKIWLNA